MNGRSAQLRLLIVVVAAAALAGCRKEAKGPTLGEQQDEAQDRGAIDSARRVADQLTAMAPSELAGSTWRLLRLTTPDGKTILPESRELYTVEFEPEGKLNVAGGCNRGSGTWKVTPPNSLSIGRLATTRAICPPESMSARYLGDFERMQSYQMVGGALFIKLAGDSGVYQFAPDLDIAQALGVGDAEPEVIFVCTDSLGKRSRVFARFDGTKPDTVTLRQLSKSVRLTQVVSASGARYEGHGATFWNKGRDARVTWGKSSLNCVTTRE